MTEAAVATIGILGLLVASLPLSRKLNARSKERAFNDLRHATNVTLGVAIVFGIAGVGAGVLAFVIEDVAGKLAFGLIAVTGFAFAGILTWYVIKRFREFR